MHSYRIRFKCCGVAVSSTQSDAVIIEPWKYWKECKWWDNEKLRQQNLVPDSCCQTQTPGCGKRDHPSNIYRSGKDPLMCKILVI